ncbi:zymogen granule membrane protein 16-like isoform X2 [Hemicordylus capensis]|uniref:zymogen granule membrane protein 16-like isoform X2 n=1 Tax=Hemicordylus capensis TaxID=884348 RepID=UPI0023038B23|nr:zymogen granule membrane protein 16-like isoform X2 [Hemicordylus capensis]
MNRMFPQIVVLVIALLGNTVSANAVLSRNYHPYSGEYGTPAGTAFSSSGEHLCGPITGFRVWEGSSSYITGIQLEFSNTWSNKHGIDTSKMHEVLLFPEEYITQVSGKDDTYIYQLIFVTSLGRIFFFGQPSGYSFNAFPGQKSNVLLFISGHSDAYALRGIGFHWDVPVSPVRDCRSVRG